MSSEPIRILSIVRIRTLRSASGQVVERIEGLLHDLRSAAGNHAAGLQIVGLNPSIADGSATTIKLRRPGPAEMRRVTRRPGPVPEMLNGIAQPVHRRMPASKGCLPRMQQLLGQTRAGKELNYPFIPIA